jgi:hypothetical protein
VSDLDAALDAVKADNDTAAWHSNRALGFGCSDLPALYAILGWVSPEEWGWHETTVADPKTGKPVTKWVSEAFRTHHKTGEKEYRSPRYLQEAAAVMKKSGLPRLIAEKAGLAKGRAQSDAMEEGKRKERHLFQQSRLGVFGVDAWYAPGCTGLWPAATPHIVGTNPFVVRDMEEPRLLCTIEAWEHVAGKRVAWELKTDRLGLRTEPPWYQRIQAIGFATAINADEWGIQYGPEWALVDEPAFPDLRDPIQWGPYPVRDEDRMMVRRAARLGWKMVEAALARTKDGPK